MTRVDLLKRLADADIAFAEVNTMADLAVHPHLRRIEVDTPNGKVSYAAPAAIFVGEPRHYGAVPGIGDAPSTRQNSSSPEPNRHDAKNSTSIICVAMDRQDHGSLRHRHRAAGEGPARHAVPGDRRAEGRRCRAVDHALVPGAAGVSDVGARARTATRPAAASCRRCRCRAGCGPAANWNFSSRCASAMKPSGPRGSRT